MYNVLLIENEPTHLLALAMTVRALGYTVLEAENPEEAVRVCQQHPEPLHVLVTKAVLDQEHASEVVTELQFLRPEMRALVISEDPAQELVVTNTNRCAFLLKPCRIEALANGIRALLPGSNQNVLAGSRCRGSPPSAE
jgi:two-component system cell cycle sensor histidine kinase/response regulator CckA